MPDVLMPSTPDTRLKQVFISYQHVNPDMELARNLATCLSGNDIAIRFDEQIGVGERWFDWIDRNVREADFLMVLPYKKNA